MADTDIDPIVARLAARIEAVPDVGLVHSFDVYSADDLVPMLVTSIDGVPALRAWWITGPTMSSRPMVQDPTQWIERTWIYQIHGVVGVVDGGSHIAVLRTLALAVSDSIDADRDLSATAHRVEPSRWQVAPENRTLIAGVGVGYVQIHKPVVTLSSP